MTETGKGTTKSPVQTRRVPGREGPRWSPGTSGSPNGSAAHPLTCSRRARRRGWHVAGDAILGRRAHPLDRLDTPYVKPAPRSRAAARKRCLSGTEKPWAEVSGPFVRRLFCLLAGLPSFRDRGRPASSFRDFSPAGSASFIHLGFTSHCTHTTARIAIF